MDIDRATLMAMNMSRFYDSACLIASVELNGCLCIDLIYMLYSPFDSINERYYWYMFFTVIAVIFGPVLSTFGLK